VYVFREFEVTFCILSFPVVDESDAERDIITSGHTFQMVNALEFVFR